VAPEPGRDQLIGEASAAAEAYGVRAGVRLGEALARFYERFADHAVSVARRVVFLVTGENAGGDTTPAMVPPDR